MLLSRLRRMGSRKYVPEDSGLSLPRRCERDVLKGPAKSTSTDEEIRLQSFSIAIRDRCSEVDHSVTSEVGHGSKIIRKCSVEPIYSVALTPALGYSGHNEISEERNSCVTSPARVGIFSLFNGEPHSNFEIHART